MANDTNGRPRSLDDFVPQTAVTVRERAEHDERMHAATWGDEDGSEGES